MQTVNRILCVIDLSMSSDDLLFRLLCRGVALCSRFNAFFSVFHAIPPSSALVARQIEFERSGEKTEKIETARKKIKKLMQRFDIEWDLFVAYGDPVIETAKAAKMTKADIVIAESHGLSGFRQLFTGSITLRMAQSVSRPFLVMPACKIAPEADVAKLEFKNIVLACSLLDTDIYLKKYALAFSEKFNSKLCLVHVMESPLKEAVMEMASAPYQEVQRCLEEKLSLQLKNSMQTKSLIQTKTHLLRGVPGEELLLYAKAHNTDLIIAGIDKRPGRIIATTATALLRYLPCAVLTVPT
jgi:nucleotide-binding universal stress UspA family protein